MIVTRSSTVDQLKVIITAALHPNSNLLFHSPWHEVLHIFIIKNLFFIALQNFTFFSNLISFHNDIWHILTWQISTTLASWNACKTILQTQTCPSATWPLRVNTASAAHNFNAMSVSVSAGTYLPLCSFQPHCNGSNTEVDNNFHSTVYGCTLYMWKWAAFSVGGMRSGLGHCSLVAVACMYALYRSLFSWLFTLPLHSRDSSLHSTAGICHFIVTWLWSYDSILKHLSQINSTHITVLSTNLLV